MDSPKYKFILSGGGTGGHIFPALSIADELKAEFPDAEFLFVGAQDRMEMQRVPSAGYNIKGLWISGIQRSQMWKNFSFPFKVISSIYRCRKILKDFKPNAVIGTGGFASGPLMYVAQKKNIPTVIQEQNSFPGITNKLLAKGAQKICVAYKGLEKYFPKKSIVITGNPIRKNIIETFNNTVTKTKKKQIQILVLGGSLGARSINQELLKIQESIINKDIFINWQCGKLYFEELESQIAPHHNLKLNAFLDDMPQAYNEADIIISRAGAGTISELCLVGKPCILIPSPNVAEDHQTKNAKAISDENAAILLEEKNINELLEIVSAIAEDENKRNTLSENIKKLAKPNATQDIISQIKSLL